MKHKAIKLPGNNIGESLGDLGFGNDFWDTTQKTQSMEEKHWWFKVIKIKKFCSVKDSIKRLKRQATV